MKVSVRIMDLALGPLSGAARAAGFSSDMHAELVGTDVGDSTVCHIQGV